MGLVLTFAGAAGGPAVAAPAEPEAVLCSEVGPTLTEESVPGDLVVDVDCSIFRGLVYGDVTVLPGTRFLVAAGGVTGDVRLAGELELDGGGVGGDVVLTSPRTASLVVGRGQENGGTIQGDVTGDAADVFLAQAVVDGTYDVAVSGTTRVRSGSALLGPATVRGGRLLVHNATFASDLTVVGSGDALLCRADVAGDLRVAGLTDYAQIGSHGPWRPDRCAMRVSGSVVLADNPHSIDLGNLTVARDLVCTGNTGPRGITGLDHVEVGRYRTGQCAP